MFNGYIGRFLKKNKLRLVAALLALCMLLMSILVFVQPVGAATYQQLDPTYRELVFQNCELGGVDPYIVLALIDTESGNDPNAVNSSGTCFGLCQIHKCWEKKAAALGCDIFTPEGNIVWCIWMLSSIQAEDCDLNHMLVRYNTGKLATESSKYSRGIIAKAEALRAIETCTDGVQ